MKFQHLTVAGIIASTMLINTPRSLASIVPENSEVAIKNNHYAYGGGLELTNKIDTIRTKYFLLCPASCSTDSLSNVD